MAQPKMYYFRVTIKNSLILHFPLSSLFHPFLIFIYPTFNSFSILMISYPLQIKLHYGYIKLLQFDTSCLRLNRGNTPIIWLATNLHCYQFSGLLMENRTKSSQTDYVLQLLTQTCTNLHKLTQSGK